MNEYTVESSTKLMLDLDEKVRVLCVDDESGLLKIAKLTLEMEGTLQVDTAVSVDEAWTRLEKEKYDVIVSDYQMPGKDGLEFLKELRERGNAIPFIMFTGKGREEVAIRALNLGANQYINKVGETKTVYRELAHSITELAKTRKAEEKQRESEEKFRDLFEKANDGFVVVDLFGRILDLNQKAVEIAEKKKEDILGKSFTDLGLVTPASITVLAERLKRHAMNIPTEPYEIEITKENGKKRSIEINSKLIHKNNTPVGTLAVVRDITERRKTEEALKESEERFSRLSAATFEGIGISEEGKIIDANDQLAKMLGYQPNELIGRAVLDIVAPESRDLVKANVRPGYEGPCEHLAMRKDGSVFPVEIRARSISYKGHTARITAIRDDTERKRAEVTLKESEAKYRSLVEQSLQGITVAVGPEPRGVFVNDAMTHIFGYTREDFYTFSPQQIAEMIHPEDREVFFGRFKERLEGKNVPSCYECRGVRKDGGIIWLEISSKQIIYEGQKAVQAIFSDITERKKTEQELRRFSTAVKTSLDGIITGDLNGKIEDVNEAAARMYGSIDKCDLIGKSVESLLVENDRTRALQNSMETVRTGQGKTVEYTALTKAGTKIPVEVTTELLRDEQGKPTGFVDIVRDLTRRKNQQRLLEESQQKFAALFSGNPEATVYVDTDMHILDVNPRFTSLFGYSLDEIKGKHISDVVVPENLLEEGRMLDEKAAEGSVYHDTVRKMKDRSLIPVSVSAAPIYAQGKLTGYVWLYKDISQQKTAEESLKESEDRFKALFVGGPEAAVYLGPDFHIRDVNPRFEQLFGYSLAEIKGKQIDDVIVQEGKMEEATMLNEKSVEGYVYHDTVRRRKDGSLVPISISAAPIIIKGQPAGLVGMYKDISDLKNAEKKLAVMNEKLRVVGGLTRHDVSNKLMIITGNAYLMKKKLKDHPEVIEGFEELESACATIVQLLEFARDYERLGVEELTYVDVEDSIEKAASLFTNIDQTKMVNECHGLTVLADSLLSKLFYNLIDNSLKHGGQVTRIRIGYEETEDELRLVYEDDGVGIAQKAKPKLFNEGYTTDKGSGHGLYLIKKMMEVYGWTVQETGLPGKGARFVTAIPRLNKQGKENYRFR